jgi:ribosomal protein L6P/L9E
MSRVGKKVIEIPKDVKVNLTDSVVEVQGPRALSTPFPKESSFSSRITG